MNFDHEGFVIVVGFFFLFFLMCSSREDLQ